MPAEVDGNVAEQRVMEQAARLGDGGAVTGWAALRMHGGTFFDGLSTAGLKRLPVPLNAGPFHQLVADERCSVSRDRLYAPEVVRRAGVPCTIEVRALFDQMRYASGLRAAVVDMDMAAAAEIASLAMMRVYVEEHPGWQGVEQVRRALGLACEDSLSPQETLMRLVWVLDAGLPQPLCNAPVFTRDGRFVGQPDLLDLEAGVVGEYDGADHRDALRHARDVDREDRFRRLGLEYFVVTGPDRPHIGRIVDRMRATRSRARFEPERLRRWTVEPPAWWRQDPSLDERIATRRWREDMRARYEADALPDVRDLRGW